MIVQYAKRLALIVPMAAMLSGCVGIKTGSHQDESVSFSGYRTFTWIAEDPLIQAADDPATISPLSQKKIVDAIANTLSDKGYTYTPERKLADFVVSYTVGTREKVDASSYPSGYGGTWGWHLHGRYYYEAEYRHRSYTEGTLGIDIFDGKSNQPVWHGWASKTISSADREDPSPTINNAVKGILDLFPTISGDESSSL